MKLLIWDFHGTLGYREGGWTGPVLEVIRRHAPGATVTAEKILPWLQSGFPWHTPDRPHPEIASAEAWWGAVSPVFQRAFMSNGFDPNAAREMAGEFREVYTDLSHWHLFDDTLPVLDELSARSWTHVVLSNHVPELQRIMNALDLGPRIARTFNSAETGYEKPHPQAFRNVLDAFSGAKPIWMIGDSMTAAVGGAERVGIPGILVRVAGENAERSCDDLACVCGIVNGDSHGKDA
jgi:putative hydrolase of the HAD superfamily